MKISSAVVAAVIAILVAGTDAARADPTASPLTLCNQMSDNLRVAVGYFSSGINDTKNQLTGPFVSRGWSVITPGQCQTFDNPFSARYMFWYAWAHGLNDNEDAIIDKWKSSDFHFCVTDYFSVAGGTSAAFIYEDENAISVCSWGHGDNLWVIPRKVDTAIQSRVDVTGQ